MNLSNITLQGLVLMAFGIMMVTKSTAQQDPQYTQYMYNTMTVNPAYAGQRDVLSVAALYRMQWVGIDGAPRTLTLGAHQPLKNQRIGLGLNVVKDEIGPTEETTLDINASYTIPVNPHGLELSFGVKGGVHFLDTDWSKGNLLQQIDPLFTDNINLITPTLGAGLYLHSEQWYFGASVPNILTTKHYDDFKESIATERLHVFVIGGYVFNLSETTKLKPAFLMKAVSGAPLIADVSANVLFNEKLTLGVAWRWDDAMSALAGFQISKDLFIGYAYDLTTTNLNNYNSGTHEIMLRYELQEVVRLLSPRFF